MRERMELLGGGLSLAARITAECDNSAQALQAVQDAGPAERTSAIVAVMAGERCISPSASGAVIGALSSKMNGRAQRAPAAPHLALSPRQLVAGMVRYAIRHGLVALDA